MHPWDHARSSVNLFGGKPSDYIGLHSWFDATKSQIAHFTHRALRHHAEGVEEAIARFGPIIEREGRPAIATREIAHQHIMEDCRRIPSAAEWLEYMRPPEWLPREVPKAEKIAEMEARLLDTDTSAVLPDLLPLNAWFLEPLKWFEDPRALAMRHHSFGIFEAEELFGVTLPTKSGRTILTRYVAERHVRRVIGKIPTASDWLRCIAGQKWMVDAKSPSMVGL